MSQNTSEVTTVSFLGCLLIATSLTLVSTWSKWMQYIFDFSFYYLLFCNISSLSCGCESYFNNIIINNNNNNNNNNRFTQVHNSLTVNVLELGALWFTTETVIYSSKRCVLISCWTMKKLILVEVTEYATTPGGEAIQSLSLALETWHAIK